jgi:hypothetical protein
MQVRPGDDARLNLGFDQREPTLSGIRRIFCSEAALVDDAPDASFLRRVHHRLSMVRQGDGVAGENVHTVYAAERRAERARITWVFACLQLACESWKTTWIAKSLR